MRDELSFCTMNTCSIPGKPQAIRPLLASLFRMVGKCSIGPSATFTWAAADLDGDTLTYTVEYSADNGVTWKTLAINWNSTSLQVDVTKLRGSNQALIRVTASDGFNCHRRPIKWDVYCSRSRTHRFHLFAGGQPALCWRPDGHPGRNGADIEDGIVGRLAVELGLLILTARWVTGVR